MMPALASASPVAFVITRDRARSKPFYETVLGLKLLSEDSFAAVFDIGGVDMRLTTVPNHQPSAHTVLGWNVSDIRRVAAEMRDRGVVFSIYDGLGQDDQGIWTSHDGAAKVAWFNDPDGNVLSLTEYRG